LTSFKSLFLEKFQAYTLDQSHQPLVKLSCESACENLDAISARSAVCLLQPILQLGRSHRGRHFDCVFLYLHTCWCILLRSEIPSGLCATLRSLAASNNRVHPTRSLCNCLFAPLTFIFVLRAHPVRGESHNQRNTTGEVATIPTHV